MKAAYLTHASSTQHSMGPHPECPERVQAVHRRLLESGLLARMDALDAPAATRAQILRVHDADHVDRLAAASPASGFAALDPDTAMNPHTWTAMLHAAGAAVEAVDLVMGGSHQRAFCNVRPPGHHAERDRPMGFCFVNNIAVAAAHALDAAGARRVAIVDFDVHHGNGTEDIFRHDPRVIMVSSFQRGLYPGTGERPLGPNMFNVALPVGSDGVAVRAACEQTWLPRIEAFAPDLVLISAGFDAHRDDPLAGLNWEAADYHWLTERLVTMAQSLGHGRVIASLEGGYALDALAESAAAHVAALLGDPMAG